MDWVLRKDCSNLRPHEDYTDVGSHFKSNNGQIQIFFIAKIFKCFLIETQLYAGYWNPNWLATRMGYSLKQSGNVILD